MPGCLQYFCAEWRRQRKVVVLEEELLYELVQSLGSNFELDESFEFVQKNGLRGWSMDPDEELVQALKVAGAKTENSGFEEVQHAPVRSAGWRTQRSPRDRFGRSGTLNRSGTMGTPRAASPRMPKGDTQNLERSKSPTRPASPTGARADVASTSAMTRSVLFMNASHPLANLPAMVSREDFVQELRRRLRAQRLFKEDALRLKDSAQGGAGVGLGDAVLTMEEAEDLYETLLQMQKMALSLPANTTNLLTGKQMDATVDYFFQLSQLRNLVERGAPSINAFLSGMEGQDPRYVDTTLLHQFLDLVNHRLTAERDEPVAQDTIPLEILSKENGGIEIAELRRRLAFVNPVAASLADIQSHLEVKYGSGRSKLPGSADFAQLFAHFTDVEHLDLAPEDVARTYRAWGGSLSGVIYSNAVDDALRRLPIEALWGIEPFTVDQIWSALGTRCLQMERLKKMDASLPPEAVLEAPKKSEGAEEVEENQETFMEADLRERFEKVWSRCVSDGMYFAVPGEAGETGTKDKDKEKIREEKIREKERQMKEACFSRYLNAVRSVSTEVSARQDYASVFTNISDVLSVSTSHLRAGQVCVVRYRLAGACNYWHPNHRVLKDEREPLPWPVPRKVLGETPFVALVPRGLRWTSAGGGGFYLGTQAFNQVDPGLRADLPLDRETGQPLLFGSVELVAPFLLRGNRRHASGATEELEFRLFSSRKNRIIGCVGEPVRVKVMHQVKPPPTASLQVCCDGRNATLRWAILDLGPNAPYAPVETVRLHVKTERMEQMLNLKPDSTEFACPDLLPDMDYEFRLRLESHVGAGGEASCTCRTNSRCSTPQNIIRGTATTTQVDLIWKPPENVGNETTRDKWQLKAEAIVRYEAKLFVAGESAATKAAASAATGDKANSPRRSLMQRNSVLGLASANQLQAEEKEDMSRRCIWPAGSWTPNSDGSLCAKLSGLRPDTHYSLEGFCAVNSMGNGIPAREVNFWTMPVHPVVESIRVRQGQVHVTLSETGGGQVKEFEAYVSLDEMDKKPFQSTFPEAILQRPPLEGPGSDALTVLPLPFDKIPVASSSEVIHSIKIRAKNPGGWSEWSQEMDTVSIARQQGADKAQARLLEAMERRRTTELAAVLHDVRDIEFSDKSFVEKAAELLKTLEAVKAEVDKAMDGRDPEKLREALERAHEVLLPDLEKAEELLLSLQDVCHRLDTARGIDALRDALRAGHEARIPMAILQRAVERLGTREAAQQGLEAAIEAARVPVLSAALETAKDMHLPSEGQARDLLAAISHSEQLLKAALESKLIVELADALDSAAKSGLREDDLIARASELHMLQLDRREAAQLRLEEAQEGRFPDELKEALRIAAASQVSQEEIEEGSRLLKHLELMLAKVEAAVGEEERGKTLEAAHASKVPQPLLQAAETQLSCLKDLHMALAAGDVPATCRSLKLAMMAGNKELELAQPREVFETWSVLARELEIAVSLGYTDRLRAALADCEPSGICEAQLEPARDTLDAIERRDAAELELHQALETYTAESIQQGLRVACDADVADWASLARARDLLDHMLMLRLRLSKALESMDLERLYAALEAARGENGLPDKDLANFERTLEELQEAEFGRLERHAKQARELRDFRAIDGLLTRAAWAAEFGVQIDRLGLGNLHELARELEAQNQQTIEGEIQRHRMERDWPRVLDSYDGDGGKDDERDSAGALQGKGNLSEKDLVTLPVTVVTGEVQLDFHPRGITKTCLTLPREIVEVNIRVLVKDEPTDAGADPLEEARSRCEQLLSTLQGLLCPEDDLRTMEAMEVQDDGAYRYVAIPVALYLRAERSSRDIIEAFFLPKLDDADVATKEMDTADLEIESIPGSPRSPRIPDIPPAIGGSQALQRLDDIESSCLFNVQGRILRRITAELFWTQPANFHETMDATCFAMSGDSLVEVINCRGLHGAQYGVDQQAYRVASKGVDSLFGAVQHVNIDKLNHALEGEPDDGKRICKHQLEVRLDLLPERVTDLFFLLAATNARDLSKFSNLGYRIVDTDIGADLARHKGDIAQLNYEAVVIMCSIYKLGDNRWRIGAMKTLCSGSPRDFKPAINKLSELGYPRNKGMAKQEHVVLEAIRRHLELPRPSVKLAQATLSPEGREGSISINFVIEVVEGERATSEISPGSKMKTTDLGCANVASIGMARGENLARRLSEPEFGQAVLDEIFRFTSEKVPAECLRVMEPIAKPFNNLGIEVRWEFSEVKRADRDHTYLDVTILTFDKRNLQEVIDYRGPHGVRIVHNCIVDYAGMWIGNVGTGDAADGAIEHAGVKLDELPRVGKCAFKVKLDQLPPSTTDLYILLSSPSGRELSKYSNISAQLVDADQPAHEVSMCLLKSKPASTGLMFCRISRAKCASCGSFSDHGSWKLGPLRIPHSITCHDLRDVINSIRHLQQEIFGKADVWPHKISAMSGEPTRLREERRLLPLTELRKKTQELQRQDSTGSISSLINWSPTRAPNLRSSGEDPENQYLD